MLSILKALAFSGGDWIIWVLIACSVLALAVIIERGLFLKKEEAAFLGLQNSLMAGEEKINLSEFDGSASRLLGDALTESSRKKPFNSELFAAKSWPEKNLLEKRLLILGTLGSNAPFIGLLGTVLGVIKAFHDLSQSGAGPEVVMKGLSEALVTTAIGLFVAIPCVISYNYFQDKVQKILSGTESLIVSLRSRSE